MIFIPGKGWFYRQTGSKRAKTLWPDSIAVSSIKIGPFSSLNLATEDAWYNPAVQLAFFDNMITKEKKCK